MKVSGRRKTFAPGPNRKGIGLPKSFDLICLENRFPAPRLAAGRVQGARARPLWAASEQRTRVPLVNLRAKVEKPRRTRARPRRSRRRRSRSRRRWPGWSSTSARRAPPGGARWPSTPCSTCCWKHINDPVLLGRHDLRHPVISASAAVIFCNSAAARAPSAALISAVPSITPGKALTIIASRTSAASTSWSHPRRSAWPTRRCKRCKYLAGRISYIGGRRWERMPGMIVVKKTPPSAKKPVFESSTRRRCSPSSCLGQPVRPTVAAELNVARRRPSTGCLSGPRPRDCLETGRCRNGRRQQRDTTE